MAKSKFIKMVIVLAAAVAAAYLAAGIMFTRGGKEMPAEEMALSGDKGATSIIQNFQHIESHLDRIGWELSAGKAELMENTARLYNIKMRFFTPQREIISLEGETGTIDLSTNNILVQGKVAAAFNDRYYFYADEVSWDAGKKQLVSLGPVRIVSPQGEIAGATLLARPYSKRFLIEGGVTVDFKGNLKNQMEVSGAHS